MKFTLFATALAAAVSAANALTTSETFLAVVGGNVTKPYKLNTLAGLAEPFLTALVPVIDGPNVTLFAPTDDAFNKALTETIPKLAAAGIVINITDPNILLAVLQFHAYQPYAEGASLLPSYLDSKSPSKLTTQNPQVSFNTGKAIQNNLFPAVNVVEVIPTDNGRIEVVDGVLLPPLCPSQTAAFAGADFSILRDVLGQTNLSSVVDTLPNATIFAPTNAAFNAALAELGKIPNVNVSDPAVIASVLLYHVVPAVAYSTQLPDGASEVPSSLIVDGKVQMIPITKSASGVVVGRANVTIANVGTCNGVIHVIDAVLVPPSLIPPTTATTAAPTSTAAPTATSKPASAGRNSIGLAGIVAVLAAIAAF